MHRVRWIQLLGLGFDVRPLPLPLLRQKLPPTAVASPILALRWRLLSHGEAAKEGGKLVLLVQRKLVLLVQRK